MNCLDAIPNHPEACEGDVSLYQALSGSGERYPRCEKHYRLYVITTQPKLDEIRKRYYLESKLREKESGDEWVFYVAKAQDRTPHALRQKAEERVKELEEELSALKERFAEVDQELTYRANR